MSAKPKITVKTFKTKSVEIGKRLQPYRLLAFIIFVAVLYGFVFLRISSLSDEQPSQDAVNSQVKAANLPRIDPSVVNQLYSLQDHSVSVQALFDQARNNPFAAPSN